jgi:hypothetical protein
MSERFVIVHRTYDPIQAELVGSLLRDAGIPARVTGTRSGALIGVAQNILEVHIAVPESQAGQATDFLEAYFSAEPTEPSDEEAEAGEAEADTTEAAEPESPEDEESTDERPVELRPLLAAGSAFLTFGFGHLYARRPATGIALGVGQLVAMVYLIKGTQWADWTLGLTALIGILICDVAGAVVAARAHRRGVRRGLAWQSGLGVLYVGGVLAVAAAIGPQLADPTVGEPVERVRRDEPGPLEQVGRPLEHDPMFPPLTSEHPANPSARHR